jgi:Ni,Fe-hydrogenase maturation factor
VLDLPALTPELVADLAKASLAIFLDASLEGPIGEIISRRLTSDAPPPCDSPHGLQPGALLRLSQELYARAPQACLLTSRGVSFELADGQLTPAVSAALEKMVDEVRRRITHHLKTWPDESTPDPNGI